MEIDRHHDVNKGSFCGNAAKRILLVYGPGSGSRGGFVDTPARAFSLFPVMQLSKFCWCSVRSRACDFLPEPPLPV
jgi:hypothetical protein